MGSTNSTHCSHQPSFPPSLLFLSIHYPLHTSTVPVIHHVFFFSNPQTSCIMKRHLGLRSACSTSNVIANGECATEQRHQQRSDSPLVKTSSLLFLPTSVFCHFNTLHLMETLTLLLWRMRSNGCSWAHFTGTQAGVLILMKLIKVEWCDCMCMVVLVKRFDLLHRHIGLLTDRVS